jgi:hypothetical protein
MCCMACNFFRYTQDRSESEILRLVVKCFRRPIYLYLYVGKKIEVGRTNGGGGYDILKIC